MTLGQSARIDMSYIYSSTLSGWWFKPTPLKNMTFSVGIMTFPRYGK
jgi:hypothetical protein